MQVSISHDEYSTGLIFKKKWPQVTVRVIFNEEEKSIIRERKLEKIIVMERGWPAHMGAMPGDFNLSIGGLLKNNLTEYTLETVYLAKQYEIELTERLKRLKEFLDENATTGGTTTFEL